MKYTYFVTENFIDVKTFIDKNAKNGWRLDSHTCMYLSGSSTKQHYVIMEKIEETI
jgi:hypothetical protein